jgi:hypothetical protein
LSKEKEKKIFIIYAGKWKSHCISDIFILISNFAWYEKGADAVFSALPSVEGHFE